MPAGGGALAIKAGDAADDRERPMSDVPNLGEKIPRSDADVQLFTI